MPPTDVIPVSATLRTEPASPRSRPPVDRDRAAWEAILRRRGDLAAIEAVTTRSPVLKAPSQTDLAIAIETLLKCSNYLNGINDFSTAPTGFESRLAERCLAACRGLGGSS